MNLIPPILFLELSHAQLQQMQSQAFIKMTPKQINIMAGDKEFGLVTVQRSGRIIENTVLISSKTCSSATDSGHCKTIHCLEKHEAVPLINGAKMKRPEKSFKDPPLRSTKMIDPLEAEALLKQSDAKKLKNKSNSVTKKPSSRLRSTTPASSISPSDLDRCLSSSYRNSLRKKLIHLLALSSPMSLRSICQKIPSPEQDIQLELSKITRFIGSMYELRTEAFKEVFPYEWHVYTFRDRETVIKRCHEALDKLNIPFSERKNLTKPTTDTLPGPTAHSDNENSKHLRPQSDILQKKTIHKSNQMRNAISEDEGNKELRGISNAQKRNISSQKDQGIDKERRVKRAASMGLRETVLIKNNQTATKEINDSHSKTPAATTQQQSYERFQKLQTTLQSWLRDVQNIPATKQITMTKEFPSNVELSAANASHTFKFTHAQYQDLKRRLIELNIQGRMSETSFVSEEVFYKNIDASIEKYLSSHL